VYLSPESVPSRDRIPSVVKKPSPCSTVYLAVCASLHVVSNGRLSVLCVQHQPNNHIHTKTPTHENMVALSPPPPRPQPSSCNHETFPSCRVVVQCVQRLFFRSGRAHT